MHQLVQTRPARFGAGDPVGVLVDDFIAALDGHLAEVEKLGLRVLIQAGDPHIKDGAIHLRRPFGFTAFFSTYSWMYFSSTSVMFNEAGAFILGVSSSTVPTASSDMN